MNILITFGELGPSKCAENTIWGLHMTKTQRRGRAQICLIRTGCPVFSGVYLHSDATSELRGLIWQLDRSPKRLGSWE